MLNFYILFHHSKLDFFFPTESDIASFPVVKWGTTGKLGPPGVSTVVFT